MTETIREPTLRELIRTGVAPVHAVGQEGGFRIAIGSPDQPSVLASTKSGAIRVFPNLTTLATYLHAMGVSDFGVSMAHYRPGRVRAPRPDRAAALQRTRTTPRQTELLPAHDP